MNDTPPAVFTVADLQRALAAADPASLLVPPRILRRVIKRDRGLTGPGLQVPHRKSYVIARERLLRIADRDELGVEPGRELPPMLLLFPRPDAPRLAARERGVTLLRYWRLLFHARVHVALQALRDRRADEAPASSPVQDQAFFAPSPTRGEGVKLRTRRKMVERMR